MILVVAPVAASGPALMVPVSVVYAASSRICHQRPERSFRLQGMQLPVCARCFGLYAAAAIGASLAWGTRRRVEQSRILLAVSALPTAVTWGLEAAGIAPFSNMSRAVAALPLGATAGWVLVQMLRYDFLLNGDKNYDGGPGVLER